MRFSNAVPESFIEKGIGILEDSNEFIFRSQNPLGLVYLENLFFFLAFCKYPPL